MKYVIDYHLLGTTKIKNYHKICKREKSWENPKKQKKLDEVNMEELGFSRSTKLFASENLNAHFRELAWRCRYLKREKLIHSFKYQNEAFFIAIKEESKEKLKIKNNKELFYYIYVFFSQKALKEKSNIIFLGFITLPPFFICLHWISLALKCKIYNGSQKLWIRKLYVQKSKFKRR